MSARLRVMALGGLGEIGMNCLVLEQRDEALVIDCGVTFDSRNLGVDVVTPKFDALDAYEGNLVGVVLTHGHEDHIGALPYFLQRFDVPVWGTRYTLGLLDERKTDHEVLGFSNFIEFAPRVPTQLGSFRVEPIRVTHSIADAVALAIQTDIGTVVHTGDFKCDPDPPDGELFDEARFRELGDEGVSLLLSDSTNIDTLHAAGSERTVGEALEALIEQAEGAVVVAMFASNVHRLHLLGDIAKKTHRKLILLGRSVQTHARVGRASGYLQWPSDLVWPAEAIDTLGRNRILAIASGTQAEARAALSRLAHDEHPSFKVNEGDTLILSARIIPGNEPPVFRLLGKFLRKNVLVHTWLTDRGVHVSGHAGQPEQRTMLKLVRPRAFIPLHGTLHHLRKHAALAQTMGVLHTTVIENGQAVTLAESGFENLAPIPSGKRYYIAQHEVPEAALFEREKLASEGILFVVGRIDAFYNWLGPADVIMRGVAIDAEAAALRESIAREIEGSMRVLPDSLRQDAYVHDIVRQATRRAAQRQLGYKPEAVVRLWRA